jgi:hypothetical protein
LVINGTLAGLVAITANCHAVTAAESLVIGSIGGLIMLVLEHTLIRLRIDDAVGAIPCILARASGARWRWRFSVTRPFWTQGLIFKGSSSPRVWVLPPPPCGPLGQPS